MILGMIVCATGAGLVTRLDVTTPVTQWAPFLLISGIGVGLAMQIPYTAVQIVLRYGPNIPNRWKLVKSNRAMTARRMYPLEMVCSAFTLWPHD